MPQVLQKIFTALVGILATGVVLVLVVEAERVFPLPAAAGLAREYWLALGDTLGNPWERQARFYLFMLGSQWLLWLVPVAGVALTALMVRRVGDEEVAAYLTRLHVQQKQIETLEEQAKNSSGHWGTACEAFDRLMDKSSDLWLVVGRDGKVSRANRAVQAFVKVEQPVGHDLQKLLPWLPKSQLYTGLAKAMKGEVWRAEMEIPADVPMHVQAMVWPWGGELAVWLRDVSALFTDNSLLQNAEVLVRQLVEQSPRSVAVLDAEGRYVYLSPRFAEVMGVSGIKRGDSHAQSMPGFPPGFADAVPKLGAGDMLGSEAEPVTVKGREEIISWHLRPWVDAIGRPAGTILSVQNVSELHRLRAQATEAADRENALAYTDLLTGLPNRQLFNDRLNMALAVAHRQLGKLALMFLDLDGFKSVNDTLGHEAGDLLLKQVAQRIQAQVRGTDTVARLGGDEFTIILSIRDRTDAEQVAQKLLTAIKAPYDLGGESASIGTSIGIALYPQDGSDAATLTRKADAAMYEAKQAGKNTHRFATKEVKIAAE